MIIKRILVILGCIALGYVAKTAQQSSGHLVTISLEAAPTIDGPWTNIVTCYTHVEYTEDMRFFRGVAHLY